MPLLRRCDPNSGSNVRPVTDVPDHRAANSEKEATLTKQANDFRGRIFSREDIFARGYFRKIFSREDIFAGRYFRVNSKFAKISSHENISNSLFAKFSSRENKVLYSTLSVRRPLSKTLLRRSHRYRCQNITVVRCCAQVLVEHCTEFRTSFISN